MTGLIPPMERHCVVRGAATTDSLWSVGAHPFGFATRDTSFSQVRDTQPLVVASLHVEHVSWCCMQVHYDVTDGIVPTVVVLCRFCWIVFTATQSSLLSFAPSMRRKRPSTVRTIYNYRLMDTSPATYPFVISDHADACA